MKALFSIGALVAYVGMHVFSMWQHIPSYARFWVVFALAVMFTHGLEEPILSIKIRN